MGRWSIGAKHLRRWCPSSERPARGQFVLGGACGLSRACCRTAQNRSRNQPRDRWPRDRSPKDHLLIRRHSIHRRRLNRWPMGRRPMDHRLTDRPPRDRPLTDRPLTGRAPRDRPPRDRPPRDRPPMDRWAPPTDQLVAIVCCRPGSLGPCSSSLDHSGRHWARYQRSRRGSGRQAPHQPAGHPLADDPSNNPL
jgi:hypothetical protein